MERLSYSTLEKIGYAGYILEKAPEKVLQFGEGNFLRAFVDYFIDIANEKTDFNGSIVLVKPITFGNLNMFHEQDCRYTVMLRGLVDGEAVEQSRLITSVSDAVDAYAEYEKYADYAAQVEAKLKDNGILATMDNRSEKIGFKIREAQLEKIPYMIIVGEKEEAEGTVAVRKRGQGDLGAILRADFIKMLDEDITSKKIW